MRVRPQAARAQQCAAAGRQRSRQRQRHRHAGFRRHNGPCPYLPLAQPRRKLTPEPTFSFPRGWSIREYAIRTSNWSHTKKRALSLQVRDPHNCDHVPVIVRLLFCVLVAGPDKVLLGRKGLFILLKSKLAFGDMADHGIHHRWTHSL